MPSVLDEHAWDIITGEDLPVSIAAVAGERRGEESRQGHNAESSAKPERPPEVCGVSAGPCFGIKFEV